jgi:hypothetical protein
MFIVVVMFVPHEPKLRLHVVLFAYAFAERSSSARAKTKNFSSIETHVAILI